jgi:heme-degrading monooxygenase HmoA
MGASQYTSGNWLVKEGSEDDFIKRWTEFTDWTSKNSGGARSFFLIREDSNPRHFLSFGAWNDFAAVQQWRQSPEFAQRLGTCRELCDDFEASDYSLASEVS